LKKYLTQTFNLVLSLLISLFLSAGLCSYIFEINLITNKYILRSLFFTLLALVAAITYRLMNAIYNFKFNYQKINELGILRTANFMALIVLICVSIKIIIKLNALPEADRFTIDNVIPLPAFLCTLYLASRFVVLWAFWCVDGFLNKQRQ
jgi:hypothetical protein